MIHLMIHPLEVMLMCMPWYPVYVRSFRNLKTMMIETAVTAHCDSRRLQRGIGPCLFGKRAYAVR